MAEPVVPADIVAFLVHFRQCFTRPSGFYFEQFVLAFCLASGRRTVTAVCRFARTSRHFTNFHRFLSQYRWSPVEVSRTLAVVVLERLGIQQPASGELWVPVALDDTLTRKTGRTLEAASWQHDGAAPNPLSPLAFGHCWVTLGLLWAWSGRWLFFAWAARLFRPPKVTPAAQQKTKLELAVELIRELWLPRWLRLWVITDGAYGKEALVSGVCALGHHVISRLRSDSVVHEPPIPTQSGEKRRGRPRKYGAKRKLAHFLALAEAAPAQTLRLYGSARQVRVRGFQVVSWAFKRPVLLVVVVPVGWRAKPTFLFTTDLALAPERVVEMYAARFAIELAFRDLKQHFGLGDYQVQSAEAAQRHVTLALVAYTCSQLLMLAGVYQPFGEPWRATPAALTTGQLRYQLRQERQARIISELLRRERIPRKICARVYAELTQQPGYC